MNKRETPNRTNHPNFRSFYRLRKPCANCPFLRTGGIHLRQGRLKDIVDGLLLDDHSSFVCHKTANYSDEAARVGLSGGEVMCAGAAAYLAKVGRPTVGMRVAQAFGAVESDHWREAMDLVVDQVE